MPSNGNTPTFICCGIKNQQRVNNAVSTNTIRKYCCNHFLFKYTTKATKKCVGNAQSTLKLLRQTASTRITHKVTVSKPKMPRQRKKKLSNTFRKPFTNLVGMTDNNPIITNSTVKINTGGISSC